MSRNQSAEAAGYRFGYRLVQVARGALMAFGLIFLVILIFGIF